jgi:L-arabinose isomerase
MKYFVLDKDTDELVEVLENISQHDIEKYELENPDKYITNEDDLDDDFDEDQIGWDLIFGEDDVW